jgi:hypothetical protein
LGAIYIFAMGFLLPGDCVYRRFLITALLLAPAAGLVSCLFDSGESSAKAAWLNDNGLPVSYNVKTLELDSLMPLASAVGFDSTPVIQSYRAALGGANGIDQALLFDLGFRDSTFFAKMRASGDSGSAFLRLYTDSTFYADTAPDSLPITDKLRVRFSWKQDLGKGSDFLDSIGDITDSAWVESWRPRKLASDSADTSVSIELTVARDSFDLPLPAALVKAIYSANDAQHLQLQVRVLEATRILRVRSLSWNSYSVPLLKLKADTLAKTIYSYRLAQQSYLGEGACSKCLLLHGGVRESLVVEFNAEPIMAALSDLYNDQFPYVVNGDTLMDIRQAVVMAQISMGRTSSKDGSELGYPVPIFASSLIDSLQGDGSYWQYTEGYKLDTNSIKANGHPNLLFFPGDSLTLQVSGALRRFLNTAGVLPKQTFRVVLRFGRPMLEPYDLYFYDHTDDDGNTVQVFADNSAFVRYDFAKALSAGTPVRLKLWLASNQEGEQ